MLPQLKQRLLGGLEQLDKLKNIHNESFIKDKCKMITQRTQLDSEIRKIVTQPENVVPFLVPGRLIKIKTRAEDGSTV